MTFYGGGFYFSNTHTNKVFNGLGGTWIDQTVQTLNLLQISGTSPAYTVMIGNPSSPGGCNDHGTTLTCIQTSGVSAKSIAVAGTAQANAFRAITAPVAVIGSSSGSASFVQPEVGSAYKKVIINLSALSGTATWTFTQSFSHMPVVLSTTGLASSLVTSLTTGV